MKDTTRDAIRWAVLFVSLTAGFYAVGSGGAHFIGDPPPCVCQCEVKP